MMAKIRQRAGLSFQLSSAILTSMSIRILTIGKATQDVFLQSHEFDPHTEGEVAYTHLPLGAKLDIENVDFATGGNATNVATTLARQGLDAAYFWCLGHDPSSEASLAELDINGVDTHFVVQDNDFRAGYSAIMLAPNGERTILNYKGVLPRPDEPRLKLELIAEYDWVYPTSLGEYDLLPKIVEVAEQHNVKIMLNPAGPELSQPDKLRQILSSIDILCLNKEEMQTLVEGETIEELVRHGLNYCQVVIVSDGPRGVCASDGKTIVTAGMYEDVPVIDRTGAGDAFASGFLSQWVQEKSLRDCILFASANSTSVVQYIGAKKGILGLDVTLHDMPIEEKPL